MWLLSLLRRNTSLTSRRLFTASRPPRRWVAKSFVTDTKHSWRRSWRICGSRSANTMRSEDYQHKQSFTSPSWAELFASAEIYLKKVSIFLTLVLFPFMFPFKVQKPLQCLPDPCGAVRLGVPSVRAVQCVALYRPGHLRLDMWLCYGPDHGSCADVGLHPLLWTLSQCRRSHRPGRRSGLGAGAFLILASDTGLGANLWLDTASLKGTDTSCVQVKFGGSSQIS